MTKVRPCALAQGSRADHLITPQHRTGMPYEMQPGRSTCAVTCEAQQIAAPGLCQPNNLAVARRAFNPHGCVLENQRMMTVFNNLSVLRAWLYFSSIFTCLALGDIIGEHFFDGSRIPWFIALAASCVINWNLSAHIKKLSRPA
ncbi:hypothetical protein PFH44_16410 [Raoultella sp. Ech2A]|uniref:hypothetical protein n=1 Tax=Raoultella sp. Ech2A TaxID=2996539 RepID=UPI0024BF2CCF|nr:hypothetical protein [Raoultella sp. Ech2A]MDJ1655055.1 hypothetical protein [Raoultella sp. Ech2A]